MKRPTKSTAQNASCSSKVKTASSQKLIKKRRRKGKEKLYTLADVKSALDAIGKGVTLREASDHFGVPKTTLHAKLHNHSPLECTKGPSTILSKEEENDILSWIFYSAEKGFPVNKVQLLDCIQKYLNDNNKVTVFKHNRPGKHWYSSFMRRHPQLSLRMAQNLTSSRASVTEENLRRWFSKVKTNLEKKSLINIDPCRIFNLDESAFSLVPKDNCVLTRRGAGSVYKIVSSDEKASLTVLFIASANGKMLPPMILYDCKTTPRKQTLSKIPSGWVVGNTETGWMTAESFFHYILNGFIPWIKNNNIQLSVVLYVDGHVSHLSFPLMKLCIQNQIELTALFPNATHIIQPLDVAVFHKLKDKYKDTVRKWKLQNEVVDFKKHMFAPVLDMTLSSIDLSSTIKNGFRTCGLYPFSTDAVNYNIINKHKKKLKSNSSHDDAIKPNKNQKALDMFEKNILSPSVLSLFKTNLLEDSWTGDPDLKNHFDFWKTLLNLCSMCSIG